MTFDTATAFVDRLVPATGGGRVLVIGATGGQVIRAFRRRAIDAMVGTFDNLELPYAFDVIVITDGFEQLGDDLPGTIDKLRALKPRALALRVPGPREDWERRFIDREWRRHPLYQALLPKAIQPDDVPVELLMQPLPLQARLGRNVKDLVREKDLRMDMLRDTGPRADAHVARYEFARSLIRPGDRVLDASSGLGYGSALLAEGTMAESILGVDLDEQAVAYANQHYAEGRKRLTFERRDLSTISGDSRSTFDLILCFDTIEHLANPGQFLTECQRLLTPGGRFVGSVEAPVDNRQTAANENHLHIFTRPVFEQLCKKYFDVEQVCGQTAQSIAPSKAVWPAGDAERGADWWLLVGMTDPFQSKNLEFRHGQLPPGTSAPGNLLAFERDYDRPWLLRALISLGFRTDAVQVLERLAKRSILTSSATAADRGAALCVRAYLHMDRAGGIDAALMEQIEAFCKEPAANPAAFRWQVSLRFAQGLAFLDAGDNRAATVALEQCANADPLKYHPILALKTVSAAWLLGWMSLQAGDREGATTWWTNGMTTAERVVHRPWDEFVLSRTSPITTGLRDAAQIVDLASQCATGLHLLPHAADRPGVVASQLADSMSTRLQRFEREERMRVSGQQLKAEPVEIKPATVKPLPRATALLKSPVQQVPGNLKVAIFGVGPGGQDTLAQLRRRGANVECFSDVNAMSWYAKLDGVPVVAPAALRARKIDLIAIASGAPKEASIAQLERLGYRLGHDFDCVA